MLKPLRYFFFRVYSWKRLSETEPLALFSALSATTAAVYMHVLTLEIVVPSAMKLGAGLTHDRNTSRAIGIAIGLLIMVALYRAWIASNSYVKFAERSLMQGLAHPLVNPYGITPLRLLLEGSIFGGAIYGGAVIGYELTDGD